RGASPRLCCRAAGPEVAARALRAPCGIRNDLVGSNGATMKTWVDGALLDEQQAKISAFDHGLTVGDGVFETIKIAGGQPFALTRHLQRLAHSARGLGLAGLDLSRVRQAITEVLAANRVDSARLRVTVTGGPAPLGSERGAAALTVIVALGPFVPESPAV